MNKLQGFYFCIGTCEERPLEPILAFGSTSSGSKRFDSDCLAVSSSVNSLKTRNFIGHALEIAENVYRDPFFLESSAYVTFLVPQRVSFCWPFSFRQSQLILISVDSASRAALIGVFSDLSRSSLVT